MARTNENYATKKEDLVKQALALFMEHGYENVTISKLIKELNISKGALYHYFESKEEILDSVIEYLISKDEKEIEAMVNRNASATEKLIQCIHLGFDTDRHKASVSEELKAFDEYVQKNRTSVFVYRAADFSKRKTVGFYKDIIIQGVLNDEFDTKYPEAVAELIYACSEILLKWLLTEKNKRLMEEKVKWFVTTIEFSLVVTDGQLNQLGNLIKGVCYE